MSKHKSSEIDTVIKINFNLKKQLIDQVDLFELSKNENLLIQLNELIKFKKKKIENNETSSNIYSEITIFKIKKIIDVLCKLECYHHIRNPADNLRLEIDKLKDETKYDLTMSEFEFNQNIEDDIVSDNELNCNNNSVNDKPINQSNYDEENFDETNYDNESIYDGNNYGETNCNLNESIDEFNNEHINQTVNQTINKSTNNDKSTDESLNNEKKINRSSNNDKAIEDLYPLIFNNLSVNDLFNCRLVNKQFKYFSDHTDGLDKLIIGQPISACYWHYNDKSIEAKDIISLKCFRSIKLLSIFNLDKNLKYLKIYDRELKLKEILNFINLESIEFGYRYKNNIYDQQIINLNNLKVFMSNDQSIKLVTPKLEKIKFTYMNKIQLDINPELIKHLITTNYDHRLAIFKNLEIFELIIYTKQPINDNLLITFKNLKQLKIVFATNVNYSEEAMNSLIKILNDKIKLRRNVDIYVDGVKIENIDKFKELKSNKYSFWKFRLNNYDLLDLNSPFTDSRYEELEECVNNIKNDLPSSFFDKFLNIKCVRANYLKDIDGFNWFLNNLKYLTSLYIGPKVLLLDEVFYNNLPNTINWLSIENKKDLNYDFILKLSNLIKLHTNVDKDLFDLAFTSFLNLKYLEEFKFNFKKTRVNIRKDGQDFYLNDERRIKKLDYNQLIVKCNIIRSK